MVPLVTHTHTGTVVMSKVAGEQGRPSPQIMNYIALSIIIYIVLYSSLLNFIGLVLLPHVVPWVTHLPFTSIFSIKGLPIIAFDTKNLSEW